jgi:hypothetical protein
MSKLRAAMWSLAIGVMAVVLAALLFRLVPLPGAAFAALLALCAGLVSLAVGLVAEAPTGVGLAGGIFGAALVAAVLWLTIALAPLAPGAHRPGFSDLLWLPLLALLATIALCGAAGFLGISLGLHLARRDRDTAGPTT